MATRCPTARLAAWAPCRFRHTESIFALAFTPDGRTLASGGADNVVRLWDVRSGKQVLRVPGFEENRYGLAIAPDGKTAASPGGGVIHIWNTTTGKDIRLLHVPQGPLTDGASKAWPESLAFAPDGKSLAAAVRNYSVCTWDTATGKLLWPPPGTKGEDEWFNCVRFSPDGKYFAAGGRGLAYLWEASSGKPVRHVGEGDDPVFTVAFSPDSSCLAEASGKTIRLWEVASGKLVRRFTGCKKNVGAVLFTLDGKTLIGGDEADTIRFWDAATGQETRRIEAVYGDADNLALSPDGRTLASGGSSQTVRLWDTQTGAEKARLPGHVGYVMRVAFAPDGKRVASAGYDAAIRIWDAASGKEMQRLEGHTECVTAIAWSPEGKSLASGADDGTVRLWDPAGGKELRRLTRYDAQVWSLAFSPDGGSLVFGGLGGKNDSAQVWHLDSGKEPRPLNDAGVGLEAVAVSPDGKLVAVAESATSETDTRPTSTLRVCDAVTGKERCRFNPKEKVQIAWLRFLPDGKTLLGTDDDDHARLWSIPSGHELRSFPSSLPPGRSMGDSADLSADGRVLAFGNGDGRVGLREVGSGQLIRTFAGHAQVVRSVSFAPGGDLLASGSEDTTILVWDVTGRRKGGRLDAEDLSPDDLERLWQALAGDEAGKAWDAVWTLAASPKQGLPFFKARLLPQLKADPERMAALIRDLDADDFDTRDNATEALRKLGEGAEPYLKKRLAETSVTAEAGDRLRKLLREQEQSPERRRWDRVFAALERTNDTGAEDVLARLSDGPADAWLTRQAKQSLQRLRKRIDGP